ncbi:MAG: hypothetical protein Q9196_005396 [Gyalolechia fulgens]
MLSPSSRSRLSPLQQAILNAYDAAYALLPHDLRQSAILIGGAVSIAHGMVSRKTEDVDILVSVSALAILEGVIIRRQGGLRRDSNGSVKWAQRDRNGEHQFFVTMELIQLGGPFAARIPEVVGFAEGWVATLAELVRSRCETFVNRGDKRDEEGLRHLLPMARQAGSLLRHIGEEEMGVMVEAVMVLEDEGLGDIFMSILSSFEEKGCGGEE